MQPLVRLTLEGLQPPHPDLLNNHEHLSEPWVGYPPSDAGVREGNSRERVFYSITSSARSSNPGGISSPSAFAVVTLMTSWNLVG